MSETNTLGNKDDVEYAAFLQRVNARYVANTAGRAVFKTDLDKSTLWFGYLASFPSEEKQHHNCNACRHFISRYAGLVVLDEDGTKRSALWDLEDAYGPYVRVVESMLRGIEKAKVTGVFLSSEHVLGRPVTGVWRHLHAHNKAVHLGNATQAMSEKLQEFSGARRALAEFNPAVVSQALQLLDSDALYRAEHVRGPVQWLADLHALTAGVPDARRNNLIWRAVAAAPTGYAHVRARMAGTLLEDIAAGMQLDAIKKRFADKMDPAKYQRAQAAPRIGQVKAAEQAVQALGIAPAFARRYATRADLEAPHAVLWTPSGPVAPRAPAPAAASGVFDHLKPQDPTLPALDIPPRLMTWEKFHRDVLPGAALIEYRVPLVGRFCALTAAMDPAAPPILQWDHAERRNTVSWAFPHPAARAEDWNLTPGALAPVRLIVNTPNRWNSGEFTHFGKGAFLLLEGARDVRGLPGGGLFTEHLRHDLKPYRATIEAHLNKLLVFGADDPQTVGFGIGLLAGNDWTEAAAPQPVAAGAVQTGPAPERIHVILVVDDSGSMRSYIGAARQALLSLLAAVRAMPGKVDVTVSIFGNFESLIVDRAQVSALDGIEQHLRGNSGGTALNDTLIKAIERAQTWRDANAVDTSFFLGIVTDGEENQSRHSIAQVAQRVRLVNETGRWTIAYAGAGHNPRQYARSIGIPEGNITGFEASARGFEDVGKLYAASTTTLAGGYSRGLRASTSFFAAASGREAIGKDHPVLIVTNRAGIRSGYKLDRWE